MTSLQSAIRRLSTAAVDSPRLTKFSLHPPTSGVSGVKMKPLTKILYTEDARVFAEQRLTEDSQVFAEQDAAAQKYAVKMLKVSTYLQVHDVPVEELEQEVTELRQALSEKKEQESAMLQVLMRVEQEQRLTEDIRVFAEQDAAA